MYIYYSFFTIFFYSSSLCLDIVKLYDVSRTPNNLYMFLEYCMDGDLKEYLKKKKGNTLSEPEAVKFF